MRRLLLAAGAVMGLGIAPALAGDDLRDLRVGMAQAELPAEGFAGFRCAAGDAALASWAEWLNCAPDATGRRALRFGYAGGETMVAGHPVLLTAEFAEDGHLAALHIDTDASARLFLRKKAFLLGLQARGRYGEEDWTCSNGTPDANTEPVGGVFVAETCRKTLLGKTVVVQRNLFRRPGTDLKDFVGETRIAVTEAP